MEVLDLQRPTSRGARRPALKEAQKRGRWGIGVGASIAPHFMPVHRVPYGRPNRIQVPVLDPSRRVLTGDDGGVFLLTVGALGAATVVPAVYVRAEACVLPRYTVKMWANGPPPGANRKTDTVLADVEAPSSVTLDAVTLEDLTSFLTVPPWYLVGAGVSKELSLHVRIEKNTS